MKIFERGPVMLRGLPTCHLSKEKKKYAKLITVFTLGKRLKKKRWRWKEVKEDLFCVNDMGYMTRATAKINIKE